MDQPLKSIIDKIIWANLDIKDVVKAYEKEAKERREYQQDIDDAQPGAQEAKDQAAKDKKKGTTPEGPDPLKPVDENDLVSPVEDEDELDRLPPAETSDKK